MYMENKVLANFLTDYPLYRRFEITDDFVEIHLWTDPGKLIG